MASTAASKAAGALWLLSYFISFSGTCLVLAGLASMQNMCHTDGPIVTNSRRLLQLDPEVLLASCSKAYRFQWWGWGLQTSFVALVGTYWAARFKHTGIFIIGGCATVLGMIFANEQLQASDDLSGTAFSRAITTFVGWLVACTGNFLLFILTSHLPDSTYTRGTGAARCGAAKCGGAGAANVQADATA